MSIIYFHYAIFFHTYVRFTAAAFSHRTWIHDQRRVHFVFAVTVTIIDNHNTAS